MIHAENSTKRPSLQAKITWPDSKTDWPTSANFQPTWSSAMTTCRAHVVKEPRLLVSSSRQADCCCFAFFMVARGNIHQNLFKNRGSFCANDEKHEKHELHRTSPPGVAGIALDVGRQCRRSHRPIEITDVFSSF